MEEVETVVLDTLVFVYDIPAYSDDFADHRLY